MDIGIRELKARLSEFLDRAARGEMIRVTERGKPKALLGPLPGRLRIDEGVADGWVRVGNGRKPARTRRRFPADQTVADMLAEDRGE